MKKNQTLVTFIVLIVALGLIVAYIPSLFLTPPPSPRPQEPVADLVPPDNSSERATSTENKDLAVPESLQGLEEESEALDKIIN